MPKHSQDALKIPDVLNFSNLPPSPPTAFFGKKKIAFFNLPSHLDLSCSFRLKAV